MVDRTQRRRVMLPLLASSCAFALGGAFMKPAAGFTRLAPSVLVAACFLAGAVGLTIAVHRGDLSTTYLAGLGLEAIGAVAIGMFVLGERIHLAQGVGIVLVLGGLALVRA